MEPVTSKVSAGKKMTFVVKNYAFLSDLYKEEAEKRRDMEAQKRAEEKLKRVEDILSSGKSDWIFDLTDGTRLVIDIEREIFVLLNKDNIVLRYRDYEYASRAVFPDKGRVYIPGDNWIPAPGLWKIEKAQGRGYSGGHNSQAGFETWNASERSGCINIDTTTSGSFTGYYPEMTYIVPV